MNPRFTDTYDALQSLLTGIAGEWHDLNPNQKQFRTPSGSILNWYPSTGLINFQGRNTSELSNTVSAAIAGLTTQKDESSAKSNEAVTGDNPPIPQVRDASVIQVELQPASTKIATEQLSASKIDDIPTFLRKPFAESEIVLGIVAAAGTDISAVRSILEDRLKVSNYLVTHVRLTTDIIPQIVNLKPVPSGDEFARIWSLMDAGNEARASFDHSILALGAASFISSLRSKDEQQNIKHSPKRAYIISSLKHPDEVARLRELYPQGFYLIGIHADERRRFEYLTHDKRISSGNAQKLIERDQDEHLNHGQRVTDTFHLSDFFVRIEGHHDDLKHSLWRILDLLFGNPYVTPTFDEYAMFLAFAASLRSADLSRQVGAVVAVSDQVVSTGANDCPKAGGGLYWPEFNAERHQVEDQPDGRDYMRGEDSNKIEQQKIINDILSQAEKLGIDRDALSKTLSASRIGDLTEFGRVVHAEMEALLSCARSQISTTGGTLYTTTFPCHNCAKHIVAAGIDRVVFIEPYQKSKAAEFHTDSIQVGFEVKNDDKSNRKMVHFTPFVGVGPRRFFDLFSMKLGSGYRLTRKDDAGQTVKWKPEQGRLRLQMIPVSYLDLELLASDMFHEAKVKKGRSNAKSE